MIPFGELNSQFKSIEGELRAAIDDVLASGRYIFGKHCATFESEFAAYLGVEHVAGVASGTEAIQLSLAAAGVRPGDEVVTVANTCVPTVAGIVATGAVPVLVDCTDDTMTMDPAKLSAAITERTRAVVPVHLYGHPCNMDPILDIAARHKVTVIEDCAQAHGTKYKGRKCGAFGTAAAFSFYPSKNLGAYGDGGAISTNDAALDAEIRMLRNYGEATRYYHSRHGINSRLDEIQAAILRVKLRHLDVWNEARRARAREYARLLRAAPVMLPVEAPWAHHIYHLFPIRTPSRDALHNYLEKHEIGTFMHYPVPIHLQRAYGDLGFGRGAFPVAERACDEVLSLPMYPELPFEHIERVANAILEFFSRNGHDAT